MSDDDDTAWLEALAGRPRESQSRLTREGLALRERIRDQEVEDDAGGESLPEIDAARESALIERAVAEGLLAPRPATPRPTTLRPARNRRFAGMRFGTAAAAVLIVAVGVGLLRYTQPPAEIFRGAQNGTIRLEARDPAALKRRLIEELTAAGVEVSGYERLGHVGIDADLPQPVSPQVHQVLERHHIPVPADGTLIIEIDAPGQP
jgi:hypothetical protein